MRPRCICLGRHLRAVKTRSAGRRPRGMERVRVAIGSGGVDMSPTETALREAMTSETEQLSITFSIDEIRLRARRARLARAGGATTAVALAVAATVAVPALSASPG